MGSARFATLMKDLQSVGSVVRIQTHVADGNATFDVDGEDAQVSIATSSAKADDDEE